jgi:hypothetical protein
VNQDPEQLRVFAERHLLYEVEMLRSLTVELKRALDHREAGGDLDELYPLAVRNAMVESFAVRARLLIDFLYGPNYTRSDDTLAEHYIAGKWHLPDLPEALQDVRAKVDKGVAHLTYHRPLEEARKGWLYGQIWLDLAAIIRAFARQASPELLPSGVAAMIIELTEPIDAKDVIYAASVTHSSLVAKLDVSTATRSVSLSQDAPTISVSELAERTRRGEPLDG